MSKDVKRKNQKGFTLIELIVVIAILGILAAILLPQFTGFTERARGAQIRTDAQAVATAIQGAMLDGKITADRTAASPALTADDPVVSMSGVPLARFTSLTYTTTGNFVFTETINGTVHTATRDGATGVVTFNP